MVNGHLSIVNILCRKFKIMNLATLEASRRSKKQNLKFVNVLTQRTLDAMKYNGPVQVSANDSIKFHQAGVQLYGAKLWVYLKPTSYQITRNKQFSQAAGPYCKIHIKSEI